MSTITDATRWTTLPNGSDGLHVIDIIVDRPEGGHVASVTGFQAHGETCADTWAHANLIAAAPLLLHLLRQARAALPDAWSATRCGVRRALIEEITLPRAPGCAAGSDIRKTLKGGSFRHDR